MRSPRQILTVALALSPLAAAWSQWLPDMDSLVVRQDDASSTSEDQPTKTPTPEKSATDDSAKETGTSKSDDGDSSSTTKTTKSATGTSKTTKTTSAKHTTFNDLDPAGGVSMIDPPITAAEPYYRIDNTDPITWKWNYTSLQGKPSAIDVLISCSKATATWTLTQNMTFEPTATFTWDSNKFQQKQVGSQLPVEQYTLLIYDSETSFTDTADPGYLAPFSGFVFGLYTPKPYSNLTEWHCTTCSGVSPLERQALGLVFTMSLLTVLSFTWYVTGFAALA
ncbi:hypothetical protein F5Y08DRAFT_64323 [Xylaria arbuscula]|nr:hypothetical protein F5Y08DRAFT_64323 [Xylaria arbuscula]